MIMAKKKMDNLSKDMIQCEKDGFGCHYGRWKAMQKPVKIVPKTEMPEGWRKCEWCGTWYKPKSKRPQKFCEVACQLQAHYSKKKTKYNAEYQRQYRERKKAEQNG
jgi:hypothetical protein